MRTQPQAPPTQFDEMCSQLGEWDPLPTVTQQPAQPADAPNDDQRQQPIDELILAGLVSPY